MAADGGSTVLDARLVPAALSCWGATVVALTAGWIAGVALAIVLVVLAIGCWAVLHWAISHRADRWRVVAMVALAALLLGAGFAIAGAWREHQVATHPLRAAAGGPSVLVVVTPTDDPKSLRNSAFNGERRWMVRAELRDYRRGELTVRGGGAVMILGTGPEWAGLALGQPVEFRARPDPPWHRDLTIATLRATSPPVAVGESPWWQRAASGVRKDFAAAVSRALPTEAAGLLPALVIGDTANLSEQVRDEFKVAGLQHLAVVSGANFTILLSVVLFVARTLTLGPVGSALVAGGALLMFVVIARPDPSVLRAAAMGAITLLALITGRRKQALPALCAAVIGLLIWWPQLSVRAGFALSVVATAGLILLAPSWADWLRARRWWRLPAELVAVAAGAFVVTTPIMVALTGQVSLVAILANVLVALVVAPITVIGAAGLVLSLLWSSLAELVLRCAGPMLWWLLTVADRAATIPGATVAVPGGPASGVLTCLVLAVLVFGLRSAPVRRFTAVAVLMFGAIVIPVRTWQPWWPSTGWVLAACDVGQGDGLALSLGDGHAVVVDVGPESRAIKRCLDRLHITHIALLVLTHPHADHIGGLTGAIAGRSVAALAVAPHELDAPSPTAGEPTLVGIAADNAGGRSGGPAAASTTEPRQVAAIAAESGIPIVELSAGQVLSFGAVTLEVLAPAADSGPPKHQPDEGANDRSVVIAARTPAGRVLFTGDIEAPAQEALLHSGAPVRAEILKVPHHGSRTTTKDFLVAVHPRLALVSAGADNTFGHPHPEILAELHELGASVARTDEQGDVLVVGAGPSLRVVTAR